MIQSIRLAVLAASAVAVLAVPGAAFARQVPPPPPEGAVLPAPVLAPPPAAAPAVPPAAAAAPPPSPEEIAKASAEADKAIAKAKVGDVFENVTDSGVPSIRHKLSGMKCSWDPGTAINIHIYGGSARGEDVSCGANTLGITVTIYATRYPERPTARQIVEASFPAIAQNFSDVKNYEGTAVSMTKEGADQPQVVTARMTAKFQGKKVFTRSSAVVIGDWVLAQRTTGPLDQATMADILAELSLLVTVGEMVDYQAKGAVSL